MNKPEAGNGTIMKKSRAFYATIPKDVREMAGLKKGDRVHVTYNTHYHQVIITKVRHKDDRIPFVDRDSEQLNAFQPGS